ncbi:2,3-dihydro-2,3-dihydroxybenzoate dehydrogenase [Parafrankia sp. BMG5.11]|uniref:2,3-dihydro-2,3-dihydroxybenzoate dehydrogenase n=1 Tax=Parafrankia sp. BMG5.11 TaxID=222540 RepID=UPI00103E03A1|nr:2,3-dihydro-2,3-dihydroxybenzoate dehydrogenase [Parafrankia sp. BMG5.11]TCJ31480.1 2,3-dihydro-2,3-dihydroxybenzoate dehydrogenase [Parafrankia sp. BMG5.11]
MQGRVAVVTGAAGGIGAAVMRALAREGAVVAAVDLTAGGLEVRVKALDADGLTAHAFPADVSDPEQVREVVREVERRLGGVDYLVNAAGVLRSAAVGATTVGDWSDTFAVNATGVFLMSQAVVAGMVARASGSIVTVASNAAGTARTGMAAYAASKAAALAFTKCLGLEVGRYGVRCNVVSPGSTDTAMLRTLWAGADGVQDAIGGSPSAYKVGIPLQKIARPEDIADVVLFLLSDAAGHVTLQNLTVDGGATLGI